MRLAPLADGGYTHGQARAGAPARTEAAQKGSDPSAYNQRRPDGSDHSGRLVARVMPGRARRNDPLAPFGYQTLGPIAAGAFSTVVRARQVHGGADEGEPTAEVAVKSFNRAKYQKAGWLRSALKNELDVLGELQQSRHPHIANLLHLHEAPQATHAVLQYCAGGSVHRHLRSLRHGTGLTEARCGQLTHQLALAIAHLHGLGIAHRDVKPENVLYTDARYQKPRVRRGAWARVQRAL